MSEELSLPSYLRILPQRVILCTQHGSCYTSSTLERHLVRKHNLKGDPKKVVLEKLEQVQIAADVNSVQQPADGIPEIAELCAYPGYLCHMPQCQYRSINPGTIKWHYNQEHNWKVKERGRMPWKTATVQTLFAERKYIKYFAVVPQNQLVHGVEGSQRYLFSRSPSPTSVPDRRPTSADATTQAWETFQQAFEDAQTEQANRYRQLGEPQHVSEITPWLKATGIHIYLQDISLGDLGTAYALPLSEDEPILATICEGVSRVLRKAMSVLVHDQNHETRRLSRRNARLLNTFTRGEASQDPLFALQNKQSQQKYIETWNQLFCYWARIAENNHLGQQMFEITNEQWETWESLTEAVEAHHQGTLDRPITTDPSDEEREELRRIDHAVVQFSLAIIQHPLKRRAFDSVLVSFAAALFWNPRQETWMPVGNYTSYLSHLIYDAQMVVLADTLRVCDNDPQQDLGQLSRPNL